MEASLARPWVPMPWGSMAPGAPVQPARGSTPSSSLGPASASPQPMHTRVCLCLRTLLGIPCTPPLCERPPRPTAKGAASIAAWGAACVPPRAGDCRRELNGAAPVRNSLILVPVSLTDKTPHPSGAAGRSSRTRKEHGRPSRTPPATVPPPCAPPIPTYILHPAPHLPPADQRSVRAPQEG